MNKLISLVLLLWLPISGYCCFGAASQAVSVEDDTLTVIQTASFCLGFNADCPHVISYTIDVVNDEVIIDAYYDLTGAWPQVGCTSKDTIREVIAYGTYNIIFNTHVIGIDTNYMAESDTTWLIVLNQNEIDGLMEEVIISPNPTSGNVKITSNANFNGMNSQIFNASGRMLGNIRIENGVVHLAELSLLRGIYFIRLVNQSNEIRTIKLEYL